MVRSEKVRDVVPNAILALVPSIHKPFFTILQLPRQGCVCITEPVNWLGFVHDVDDPA